MKRQTGFFKTVAQLAGIIELLIRRHPRGFHILLGEESPPSVEEVHELLCTVRAPLPIDFKPTMRNDNTTAQAKIFDMDFFESVIKNAGGWEHINEIAQEFKAASPRYWGIVIDHVKFVEARHERYKSKLNFLVAKYKVCANTIMKYRREFPERLAEAILMTPGDTH
ncbi:MAG: hypothetical protein IJS40_00710 [Synergistaceae bacterium]|nr:hypothetical protein [Synergistaceae bacterium]